MTLVLPQDHPYNTNSVEKILVTASYAKVDITVTKESSIDLHQFPLSKIRSFDWTWPVLVTETGPLWDTNAIVRFVARTGQNSLLGESSFQEGLINSWIEFSSTSLHLAVSAWVYPLKGLFQLSPQEIEIAKSSVMRLIKIVDDHLLHHTFLVAQRLTIADIILSLTIRDLYVHVFDEALCRTFQNLTRWFLTCINQSTFSSALQEHPQYLAHSYFDQIAGKKVSPESSQKEVALQQTSNEEVEASCSDVGEIEEREVVGTDSDGGGLAGGATTEGSDSDKKLIKKEKKKKVNKRDIVASSAAKAIQVVSKKEFLPRKLTDQDLFGKAIPSNYFSPQATKSKPHQHPGMPSVTQAIQQPK